METQHNSISRCDQCVSSRERCTNCRWICLCGIQKDTKLKFRNHLQKSKALQPKSKTAARLMSIEYINHCIHEKCCLLDCLSHWTTHELKSYVSHNANLNQKEKTDKLLEQGKIEEYTVEANPHHTHTTLTPPTHTPPTPTTLHSPLSTHPRAVA